MPLNNQSANEPFLWGVATCGYQSEGGYNGVGQPQNNWSGFEQQGRVMPTRQAVDFWTRYEEDLQRCRQIGLNSFRLSLEWARIQPSTSHKPTSAPPFDVEALNAYAERIDACYRYELEPIVTLHHFTHPAWLGLDAWLAPETIDGFVEYVRVTITHINRRLIDHYQLPPIHWYITINEPNILAPNTYLSGQFPMGSGWGIKAVLGAYNHLLAAHTRAYHCIHEIYEAHGWSPPRVSLNTYCSDLYWSEKVLWDLLSLKQQDLKPTELPDYFHHQAKQLEIALIKADLPYRRDFPYQVGKMVRRIARWFGDRSFDILSLNTFLQELERSPHSAVFDYIALDYYDPFFAHTFRFPSFSDFEFQEKDFRGWLMSGITSKWWDWRSLPEGMHFFCQFYAQEFSNCPIMIAENGMALRRKPNNVVATQRRDRLCRSEFLKAHLQQIQRLRSEGVPMIGYLHWSLTDNYEWGSYTPRFGLFTIDFAKGLERMAEDHLGDRPSETYAQLIRESNYEKF